MADYNPASESNTGTVSNSKPDRIFIRNLLVRGIVGINPEERKNRQDILVNVVLFADTARPGVTDAIEDTVNYRTIAKAIIAHIEEGKPNLVEYLAAQLVAICFAGDSRIEAVELSLEKPGAVRFSESVGVTIYRRRDEFVAQ